VWLIQSVVHFALGATKRAQLIAQAKNEMMRAAAKDALKAWSTVLDFILD
jgi:hypothetical protein